MAVTYATDVDVLKKYSLDDKVRYPWVLVYYNQEVFLNLNFRMWVPPHKFAVPCLFQSSNFRIFNSKYDWILFNSIQANLFQQGNDLKISEHGKIIAESFTNTNPVGESRRASDILTRSGLDIAESYLDKGNAGKTDTATQTGSLESQLRKLMILPNSNVELVEFSDEQNVWQVFSLYKVRHNSSRMVKTLEGEGKVIIFYICI